MFFVVQRLGGVEHDEHQRGVGESFAAARNAKLLGFVERATVAFTQTGGVDKFEGDAFDGDALGDEVARGAGGCGDDGAVALDEAVEERALAGVGAADDGEGQAVVHDAAAGKGGFERSERRGERGDAARDLLARRHLQIVFGKIDAGFEQSDKFDERLLDGRDAAAKRAAHLAGGLARLGKGLRFNQVANGFSLREVEPAGEKGALRKLPRLGQPRAQLKRAAQQQLQHHGRAVRCNLNQIFACVRARSAEVRDHGFVDACGLVDARGFVARGLVAALIEHIGQTRVGVFERARQPHQLHGDRRGLRPAQAHNADSAAPRGRGDGGDGVDNGDGRGHGLHSV